MRVHNLDRIFIEEYVDRRSLTARTSYLSQRQTQVPI